MNNHENIGLYLQNRTFRYHNVVHNYKLNYFKKY